MKENLINDITLLESIVNKIDVDEKTFKNTKKSIEDAKDKIKILENKTKNNKEIKKD